MISILLPTRRRPQNVMRLLQSLVETTLKPSDVEVVIRYDNDDNETHAHINDFQKRWHQIRSMRLPRPPSYGVLWEQAFKVATGDIMMICGDDIVFRSQKWDDVVRFGFATNPDQIAVVFGRDGINDFNLPTHPFLSRKWIETVGYLGGGKNYDYFIDRWINDIALALGRRVYFPDIFTEHMHPVFGKGNFDEVYYREVDIAPTLRQYKLTPEQEIQRDKDIAALRAAMVQK